MNRAEFRNTPDCKHYDGSHGTADTTAQPIINGKGMLLPASDLKSGRIVREDGASFVFVQLTLGETGLFVSLTPDGARGLIEAIQASVTEVEDELAPQVDAVLRKAGGKG